MQNELILDNYELNKKDDLTLEINLFPYGMNYSFDIFNITLSNLYLDVTKKYNINNPVVTL